ncbi:hypothetical protein ACROYT_G015536 [Oculina patagonica]
MEKSWMAFVLAYGALYVLFAVAGRVSFRWAAMAESGCKKPFGPHVEKFCTERLGTPSRSCHSHAYDPDAADGWLLEDGVDTTEGLLLADGVDTADG